MSLKIKKQIAGLPEYVAGRTLEEIKQEYGLDQVYKLASNENLFGLPPGLAEKMASCMDSMIYYPDAGCVMIRKRLSEFYGIPDDQIIIGSGSDQIIEMICDTFTGPGDNIVIADPTFPIYEKSALKCGASAKKVPLKDFRQDIEGMLDAIDSSTRIFFLTNPQNPTGTKITGDEFRKVIRSIADDILIVMDEAYYEYCPRQDRLETVGHLEGRDNLMLLRTFSKAYGLAGLRIGYGLGSRKAIAAISKVRLPFNVNAMAQKAALYALESSDYVGKISDAVSKQKEIYYNVLEKEGIGYVRSYANFLLINAGEKSGDIVEGLLGKGFIVRPGENLGFPGYIRVTIATEEINKLFLDTFTMLYRNTYK
jgi:histidinol-phosphate aminotransferase